MAHDFRLPDVGEGLHEGTLVEWLVSVGDRVAVDQPFCRVETDKAVVELPAPRAAVVASLHAEPGDVVQVGEVLITFAGDGDRASAPASQANEPAATAGRSVGGAASAARPRAEHSTRLPGPGRHRPLATPHTRALARRLGVDLQRIEPSGRGGRVTDEDVQRAAATGSSAGPAAAGGPAAGGAGRAAIRPEAGPTAAVESTAEGPVERVRVSHLRRVIADAMALSTRTAARVTHVDEADVTDLLAAHRKARAHLEGTAHAKFSLLPYFIRAVSRALIDHPLLNASYDEQRQEIVLKKYYHLGVAVDTPDGLMVAVLRDAGEKSLLQLSDEIADKAGRARERKLAPAELRGATFTISSMGPLGGAFATPIIHHPESAIIGLHAIKQRPAVVDGEVVARETMFISLSYDHRIIDGVVAARFVQQVLELVQSPELLMLHL